MQQRSGMRMVTGLALIILGVLFFLDNLYIIDFPFYYIFRWQSILIFIGLVLALGSGTRSTGILLTGIGIIGLIPDAWPAIFVLFGIYLLMKNTGRLGNFEPTNLSGPNSLNDSAIFGGGKKKYNLKPIQGGKITNIFGGSEIDLSDSTLPEGIAVIEIFAMFGGSTLIVPEDWNVQVDVMPILGGFSDKRRNYAQVEKESSKTLLIRGVVIFGGGEIKN